ncbi:hypothetical protein J4E80_009581 [Alternaria sp. BMP 0032]|nr:hypothetical protein J4E80_009581 [Alternaria sp. BMP 0032]
MAEIFGTIAAAVTLGPVILQFGRVLRDGARSVKFARRELEELVNEMSIFTALSYEFYNACSTRKKQTKLVLSAQKRLAEWTEAAIEDFEQLSYTVDALSTDPIYQHTAYQVARAHYDWYRSKSYLEYLRASLSVARQSMNGFTNVCNMELLDEQLVYLKSVLTTQQRKEIEQEFGMPVEKRTKVIQSIRDGRELQQVELLENLREASIKVSTFEKQNQRTKPAEQTTQLLAFSESVTKYVDRILPLDKDGNRPPRSSPHSRKGSSSPRHDSSQTSQSTATIRTQSTQPSYQGASAAESPPTSPEPQSSPQGYVPSEWGPHMDLSILTDRMHLERFKPLRLTEPLKPINDRTKGKTGSGPVTQQTRSSSKTLLSPLNPRREMGESNPTEPSTQPIKDISASTHFQPVTVEEIEEDSKDEASEDGEPTHEQARKAGPSIWQATGAFGGDMPRGLRIRRQRSRSPWKP